MGSVGGRKVPYVRYPLSIEDLKRVFPIGDYLRKNRGATKRDYEDFIFEWERRLREGVRREFVDEIKKRLADWYLRNPRGKTPLTPLQRWLRSLPGFRPNPGLGPGPGSQPGPGPSPNPTIPIPRQIPQIRPLPPAKPKKLQPKPLDIPIPGFSPSTKPEPKTEPKKEKPKSKPKTEPKKKKPKQKKRSSKGDTWPDFPYDDWDDGNGNYDDFEARPGAESPLDDPDDLPPVAGDDGDAPSWLRNLDDADDDDIDGDPDGNPKKNEKEPGGHGEPVGSQSGVRVFNDQLGGNSGPAIGESGGLDFYNPVVDKSPDSVPDEEGEVSFSRLVNSGIVPYVRPEGSDTSFYGGSEGSIYVRSLKPIDIDPDLEFMFNEDVEIKAPKMLNSKSQESSINYEDPDE